MSVPTEWTLRAVEELAERLARQLESYEALHAAETRTAQEQWQTQQRIQQDELRMLRAELAQLADGIAALRSERRTASADPAGLEPNAL